MKIIKKKLKKRWKMSKKFTKNIEEKKIISFFLCFIKLINLGDNNIMRWIFSIELIKLTFDVGLFSFDKIYEKLRNYQKSSKLQFLCSCLMIFSNNELHIILKRIYNRIYTFSSSQIFTFQEFWMIWRSTSRKIF